MLHSSQPPAQSILTAAATLTVMGPAFAAAIPDTPRNRASRMAGTVTNTVRQKAYTPTPSKSYLFLDLSNLFYYSCHFICGLVIVCSHNLYPYLLYSPYNRFNDWIQHDFTCSVFPHIELDGHALHHWSERAWHHMLLSGQHLGVWPAVLDRPVDPFYVRHVSLTIPDH